MPVMHHQWHHNQNCYSDLTQLLNLIGPVLQREAGQLNQTTEEELSSANETLLLEEVESMLETIRGVDLTAAEAAANQEFRWVSCVSKYYFIITTLKCQHVWLYRRLCVCVCVCHWLVWFSSNVVTRAGHLVGVKSKCHRDQCRAVGVAFHICLWRFIDVGCLKWILTAMTPTTESRIH